MHSFPAEGPRGRTIRGGVLLFALILLVCPQARAQDALKAPLTLDDALARFRSHGFDLIIADASVTSAAGDLAIAKAVANPSLSISRGSSFNYNPALCEGCSSTSLGAGLTDQAAISDALSGKRRLRIAVARAALESTRSSRADVERTLEVTVKQQVLQGELAKRALGYARESQWLTSDTLSLVNTQYKAGAVSEADVARVEVQKLEADQAADVAEQTYESAKAGVAFLLGFKDTPPDLDLADDLTSGRPRHCPTRDISRTGSRIGSSAAYQSRLARLDPSSVPASGKAIVALGGVSTRITASGYWQHRPQVSDCASPLGTCVSPETADFGVGTVGNQVVDGCGSSAVCSSPEALYCTTTTLDPTGTFNVDGLQVLTFAATAPCVPPVTINGQASPFAEEINVTSFDLDHNYSHVYTFGNAKFPPDRLSFSQTAPPFLGTSGVDVDVTGGIRDGFILNGLTTAQTYKFTMTFTDARGCTATVNITLNVISDRIYKGVGPATPPPIGGRH